MAMGGIQFQRRLARGLATNARRGLTPWSGLLLRGFEAFFDQLADGFGAGGDAVGPSIVVDLLQQPGGYGEDDAGVGLLGFGGHRR
jgi:hypothetical protein